MSYTIITDSNDRVLYVSQHLDTVAYKYTQSADNKIYTLEDSQIPQDLAMWRYEHTMYTELSGWVEDDMRLSQEIDNIRAVRDTELNETDWVTIKYMEAKQDLPVEYITYREWLRDLPETYDTKEVLTSPITVVTGSWMNPKIVEELQPWSYIRDLSGTDEEYTPKITSRESITIAASAFDDVYEETTVSDTASLLTSINESVSTVYTPDETQSSVVTHNNIISYQTNDDDHVDIFTKIWDLSG